MLRKHEDMPVQINKQMRGGEGEVTVRSLLGAPDELHGKGRLFARITLPVGASIGRHQHLEEFETFYVMQGSGEYDDDGTLLSFGPGDTMQTPPGGFHSIKNTGGEPVELVALILNV